MTTHPIIIDAETLREEIGALIKIAPIFTDAFAQTGLPYLRLKRKGFESLCMAIVSQQISVAAADSIWRRLKENHAIDESTLLSMDDDAFRACGLSKQKIRYLRSLAEHHIDYSALLNTSDEEVIEILTAVTGIGKWSAEIYLLFSLNRRDVFAHNDLALQIAAQTERPKERVMRDIAANWAPHRSAASYLLWKYYVLIKGREGVKT